MIIEDGNTTEIGQKVSFGYKTPLRGMKTITSIFEDISYETGTRFFNKFFRYSFDGVKFSEFKPFSLNDLKSAVEIEGGNIPIKNDLLLDFEFVRAGTDNSGNLEITEFTINGNIAVEYLQVLDFEDTVFKDIGFTDEYWNKVWLNLLKKVYEPGIVPEAMERGNADKDDTDFIVLWKVVCYFYALLTALSENKVVNMSENEILLTDYLMQRGLGVCEKDDLNELKYLAQHVYDQSRRRGTVDVFSQDGDQFNPVQNPEHGELLRMVCHNIENDPYHFSYSTGGWFVDQNSPDYKVLLDDSQLNIFKGGDIDNYFLSLLAIEGVVAIDTIPDGREVLRFGVDSYATTMGFNVSPKIGYYISFFFFTAQGGGLDFDIKAYKNSGDVLNLKTATLPETDVTGLILDNSILANDEDFIQVIIPILDYNAEPLSQQDANLNIGIGEAVKFDEEHAKIELYWKNHNNSAGNIAIWDVRVTPMQQNTECFVDGLPCSKIFIRNTSNKYSTKEIKKKTIRDFSAKNSHTFLKII